MKLNKEIQRDISSRLNESLERIETCLDLINETELWWAPNAQCNSIGNQILHLEGNVRQYLISGLGGKQDVRKRNFEFSTNSGFSKEELLEKLKGTLRDSLDIISNSCYGTLLLSHWANSAAYETHQNPRSWILRRFGPCLETLNGSFLIHEKIL